MPGRQAIMKFDRLHRLVTLAVVWIGFIALFMSGEFRAAVVIPSLAIPLGGVFFWKALRRRNSGRYAGVVALLAGIGAGYMAYITTDYLLWAITFAVFLACLKSLYLRVSGDFMQMYALSFLSVMAAAVVNPGLSFGVTMLPYVVLLVFGLVMNNMRQSIERGVARADSTPSDADAFMSRRGIIKRRFVLMTTGITLVVCIAAAGFFFLFPRMGLGFFAKQQRKPTAVSGFSEQVTLGDFGRIVDDEEVVLRVVPHGESGSSAIRIPLRMKGQSLDSYDGVSWRKTTPMNENLNTAPDGVLRQQGVRSPGQFAMFRDVYLEPMSGSVHVLFGETTVTGFRAPQGMLDSMRPDRWRFHADFAGDVTMTGPDSSAIVYTVESVPPQDDPAVLRQAGSDYPDRIRDLYLALPPQNPGVVQLARTLSAGRSNPWDISAAIEAALRSGWRYSVESVHGDRDPLADFLLVNKVGHCEYFASGMVVLLRVLGIPARIVNGFYGGVRNEYGNYVALRRSDAHSWVEVYFPGQGWSVFDPTPPDALRMRQSGGLLASLASAMDAVKLTWYRWVVEYDLEKQIDFIGRALKVKKGSAFGENVNRYDLKLIFHKIRNLPWGVILGAPVILALLVAGLRILLGRLRGRGWRPSPVVGVRQYRVMKRLLARRGLKRSIGETQIEFACRAGLSFPGAAAAMERVARAYAAALAGHLPTSSEADIDADISTVRSAISGRRQP